MFSGVACVAASWQATPEEIAESLDAGASAEVSLSLGHGAAAPVDWSAEVRYHDAPGETGDGGRRDTFGYRWEDSRDADGPEFAWTPVDETGTEVTLGDDDSVEVALPFAFSFFGRTYESVRLSSNGYLTFGPEGAANIPHTFPNPEPPNAVIAGFWADWDPSAGGTVHVLGMEDRWIAQFTDVPLFASGTTATFQMILYENGDFRFQYDDPLDIGTRQSFPARVGWENEDGTDGATIMASSDFEREGRVFHVRSPEWLRVQPREGSVDAAESTALSVRIDAGSLVHGLHTAEILFSGGGLAPAVVPVSVDVAGEPRVSASPSDFIDFGDAVQGAVREATWMIANTGTRELTVHSVAVDDSVNFAVVEAPEAVPPGEAAPVTLAFQPTAEGAFVTEVILLSDAANAGETRAALHGKGTPAPAAVVETDPIDVELFAGDRTRVEIVLGNTGSVPLRWRTFVREEEAGEASATATYGETADHSRSATRTEIDWSHPHVPDRLIVRFAEGGEGEGGFAPQSAGPVYVPGYHAGRAAASAVIDGLELWKFRSSAMAPLSDDGKARPAPVSLPAVAEALLERNDVLYVHPDYILTSMDGPERRVIPDDPMFGQLWGLHNTGQTGGLADADIDAPEAWTYTTGSAEIVVAVIDTGIDYTHPDIAPNMWFNPGEVAGTGRDDSGNGFVDDVHGWNFVSNTPDPMDDHDHGTHCAGTVAAAGNNGIGIVGVAWEARLMALKFLNAGGSGATSDAIRAIDYATANGAHIINASFGGPGFSQGMKDAIAAAGEAGILFVAAAGNNGRDIDAQPTFPAAYNLPNIITVAATTDRDERASFSNYGVERVHLGAPGQAILSTVVGNRYASFSGTSMAAPHVAGAAALVLSRNPILAPEETKAILMESADPVEALEGITVSGGRLNARRALEQTLPPWASVEPPLGELAGGQSQTLEIHFFSRGVDFEDELRGYLEITTNDPANPFFSIPLRLTILDAPGWFAEFDSLDFGTLYEGARRDLLFPVENAGTLPLEIHAADFPAGFRLLTPLPLTLAPGEALNLAVRAEADTVGPAGGTAVFFTNDPTDAEVPVSVAAEVLPPPVLGLSHDRIERALVAGDRVVETVTLANTGENPLVFRFDDDLPAWLSIGAMAGEVAPDASVAVPVTLDAEAMSAGLRAHGITLRTDDPAAEESTVIVTMTVSDGPGLRTKPEEFLDFGPVYPGGSYAGTVTLRNAGTETLVLTGDSLSEGGWSRVGSLPGTLEPGESAAVNLRLDPETTGDIGGPWTLASNDPSNPETVVELRAESFAAPSVQVMAPDLAVALDHGDLATRSLEIENTGPGELWVDVRVTPLEAEDDGREFGELIFHEDVEAKTGDGGILGAVYVDGHFYLTGANFGPNVPQVYVFDHDINLVRAFPLPGAVPGTFGGRDITWDGEALVAGSEQGLIRFDILGNPLGVIPKPAQLEVVRGVTYVPETDRFWVCDFASDILEIDRGGQVHRSFPHDLFFAYGLAWDPYSEGGPYLWVAEQHELPSRRVHQVDAETLEFTGFSFTINPSDGWSAGIFVSADFEPGTVVLGGIVQGRSKYLFAADIGASQRWLSASSLTLSVPSGSTRSLDLVYDAGLVFGGVHAAEVTLATNDPLAPLLEFNASLDVTGIPRVVADDPSFTREKPVFVADTGTLSVRVRNEGTDTLALDAFTTDSPLFVARTPEAASLRPRESVLLEVDFTPTASGTFTAETVLATNDPATPELVLPVSAEAVDGPLLQWNQSPRSVTVHAGDRLPVDEFLENSGAADLTYFLEFEDPAADPPEAAGMLPSVDVAWETAFRTPRERWLTEADPDRMAEPGSGVWVDETIYSSPPPRRRLPFFEGFESGRWTDWQSGFGTGKRVVTAETAATGQYSFHYYGQQNTIRRRGIHQYFDNVMPTTMRFSVRAGSTTQNDANVALLDPNGGSHLYFSAGPEGFFLCNSLSQDGHISFPYEAGRWYEIALRNWDWETDTFDYYVDGLLVQPDVRFRNAGNSAPVSALYLYTQAAGAQSWWDDVFLSATTVDWITVEEPAGGLAPGGERDLAGLIDATYREPGTYALEAVLTTNDPQHREVRVPFTVEVLDAPGVFSPDTEMDAGGVEAGGSRTIDLRISNAGSQPLEILGYASDHPAFSVGTALPLTLAPGQWTAIEVVFAPTEVGDAKAVLDFQTNDPSDPVFSVNVSGEGWTPPHAVVGEAVTLSVPQGGEATGQFTLGNEGGGPLEWHAFFRGDITPGPGTALNLLPGGAERRPGPDYYGYVMVDSGMDNGPPWQWEEIAPPAGGDGAELEAMTGMGFNSNARDNDDHYVHGIELPFAFPFYGETHDTITLSSCGTIYFEDTGFGWFSNSLPFDFEDEGFGVNRFIAHFLHRINISPGAVYTRMEPDRAIIEFYRVTGFFQDAFTWQVILYKNGNIRMNYKKMEPWFQGSGALVGIQRDTITALQYLQNESALSDEFSILIIYPGNPHPDWLLHDALSGSVPGGAEDSLGFRIRAAGLGIGSHYGEIVLRTNDPGQPELRVSVNLEVTPAEIDAPRMVVNATMNVDEGGEVTAGPEFWQAASAAAGPEAIHYNVSRPPQYGTLLRVDDPLAPVHSFTQAEVDAGEILYRQSGEDTLHDSFDFVLADGSGETSPTYEGRFQVVPWNDPPIVETPEVWVAAHGRDNFLDGIFFDDPDIVSSRANYYLELQCDHGTLGLNINLVGGVYGGTEFGVQNNHTANPSVLTWFSRIQTTLHHPEGLKYTPDLGFTGTDTIRILVRDNGHFGYGPEGITEVEIPVRVYATAEEAWRHRYFGAPAERDPAAEATHWGWTADASGDGFPNLFAFLFALDPLSGGQRPDLAGRYDGVHFHIDFPVRHDIGDVGWSVIGSRDLLEWDLPDIEYQLIEERSDHGLYRARIPFVDRDAVFLRIRAER
ncbi:MAG: choice-of-anchor D domain-containing protein [Opitutales bacterium]|nr:choice-of-anchor D domain-containing protein [Opitutales bacterium]